MSLCSASHFLIGMLNVVILSVIMLGVIMLNVVMLNVVAPHGANTPVAAILEEI